MTEEPWRVRPDAVEAGIADEFKRRMAPLVRPRQISLDPGPVPGPPVVGQDSFASPTRAALRPCDLGSSESGWMTKVTSRVGGEGEAGRS